MRLPQNLASLSHESVTAAGNNVTYDVWTWLPPGYEHSDQPFPLLFLLDADIFMGAAVDTVALVSSLGEARPAIVVGVTTAPPASHMIQRSVDYSAETPTPAMRATPEGAPFSFWQMYEDAFAAAGMQFEEGFGGTDAFYRFLCDQMLPELKARHRIDADEIGVAGHSSGGDFAVDTLLRKQTPFSKFIVGSFGTDVLDATLAERERAFAETRAERKLRVFCGYGGAEQADPFLREYIERGVALMERLQSNDPDELSITVRDFDHETHGSVFPHIFSSGYRELWGTGVGFVAAMVQSADGGNT